MCNVLDIKDFVLNTPYPCILKDHKLPWDCFSLNFKEWCKRLDEALNSDGLEFDTAKRKHNSSPQWEKHRRKVPLRVTEFLDKSQNSEDDELFKNNWFYYGYKNIHEIPAKCMENVNFSSLGFPEIDEDITMWLGSEGAHTPCHYDTYGCNIVVQVYGKKLWLLFPPEAKLTSVRIPYEESSVYCSESFYSPKISNLPKYSKFGKECYKCILSPGDILIVPNKWWHYVESLSPSLTVNTWISLRKDVSSQIDESIVRFLMEKFSKSHEDKLDILNPNEVSMMTTESEILKILLFLTKKFEESNVPETTAKKHNSGEHDYQYLSETEVDKIVERIGINIEYVQQISEEDFVELMKKQSERFDPSLEINDDENVLDNLKKTLINQICNPNIVANVRKLLLKED